MLTNFSADLIELATGMSPINKDFSWSEFIDLDVSAWIVEFIILLFSSSYSAKIILSNISISLEKLYRLSWLFKSKKSVLSS